LCSAAFHIDAWGFAADKTGSDPEPTAASWVAIPAARKAQVDISGDAAPEDVATSFDTAIEGITASPFTADDTAADGTLVITCDLRGPTTAAFVSNEDASGDGSIQVSTTNEGVASEVDVSADTLTIPSNGYPTGMVGELTTTGTLPTGLSTGTEYWVISVDSNTIQLAASYADALAGEAIDLEDQGTDGAVNTFTPTAISGGEILYERSNDLIHWEELDSSAITEDTNVFLDETINTYKWIRITLSIDSGSMTVSNYIFGTSYTGIYNE